MPRIRYVAETVLRLAGSTVYGQHSSLLYPLVFAPLPLLYLYTGNPGGAATLPQLVLPLAIVLAGTAAVTLFFRRRFKDDANAALFVAVLLVIFFSYGPVHEWLTEKHHIKVAGQLIGRPRYLLPLSAVFTVAAFGLLLRYRGSVLPLFRVVTAVFLVLVLVNVVAIASGGPGPAAGSGEVGELPDIYYIIVDGYGRGDVLQQVHGFDNSPFLDALTEQGFFVASNSRTNYVHTTLSIASSLNMRYLDQPPDFAFTKAHHAIIEDNAILRLVRDLGYQYVHFASGVGITNQNEFADVQWLRPHRFPLLLSDYSVALIKSTTVGPVVFKIGLNADSPYRTSNADRFIFNMAQVRDVPNIPGPTFTFIHSFPPHPAYSFDRAGNRLPLSRSKAGVAGWGQLDLYTDEIVYVNSVLQGVVNEILRRSSVEPIVVLQADHGPRSIGSFDGAFVDPTDSIVFERTAILNAIYFPERCRSGLYSDITPVNTFRLAFDSCLGTELGLLPDETRFSVYGQDPHLSLPID